MPLKTHQIVDIAFNNLDIKAKTIAHKIGLSQSQLSRYRHGESDLTTEVFLALMKEMPLSVASIIFSQNLGLTIYTQSQIVTLILEGEHNKSFLELRCS